VAEDLGLLPLIRFRTEVTAVQLDEPTMTWTVELLTADGTEERIEVEAVVSAVGQLNRPNLPDIPGVERFEGPAFHSARWDHDVDLAGKRVAVIGTGASAAQLIPHVAEAAAHLTIFQRTPAWFLPTPDYHEPVAPEARWLLRNVPHYANWYRFWMFWRSVEGLMPAATVDPAWEGDGRSVSASTTPCASSHRLPGGGAGRRARAAGDRRPRLPAVRQAVHPGQRHLGPHGHP
jgi:4-hydroxyacetophenone monooxygenase